MSRSNTLAPLLVSAAAALIIATVTAPPAAGAIESYWNSPTGGEFHDPASWLGPVPDDTVTAIFDLDAAYVVSFLDADALSDQLLVRDGDVDLSLVELGEFGLVGPRFYDALDPLFTSPSVVVGEESAGEARLTITGGSLDSQFTIVGYGTGATGTVDFAAYEDATPSLSCAWHLHVGYLGDGTVSISNQATVTCTDAVLGTTDSGTGAVTVTGQGSLLDAWGTLSVGRQGQGTLTVAQSGDVICGGVIIGQQPDSLGDATVTGAGSVLAVNGPVDVGLEGEGTLHIDSGGALIADGFVSVGTLPPFPGEEGGGVGTATITGPASVVISYDDVYAGYQSAGTLNVLDGAAVICENGFVSIDSSQDPVGQAVVRGPGSIWAMGGQLFVRGSLTAAGGGIASASAIEIAEEGQVGGDGALIGATLCAGSISPGDPLGPLSIDGDLALQETSSIAIELGGTAAATFDALAVSGAATASGALSVTLAPGFAPELGDAFPVLSAGDLTGSFDPVSLPALDPTLKWLVDQDSTSLVLVVTSFADIDEDGSVGVTDFLALLAAWGPCPDPPDPCPADLDGDGAVGINDFLMLLANWS